MNSAVEETCFGMTSSKKTDQLQLLLQDNTAIEFDMQFTYRFQNFL